MSRLAKLYRSKKLSVVFWGDYGMWSRPEFLNDRVSYPVCPVTAAVGMVRQIYWHPDAKCQEGERSRIEVDISAIKLLAPIDFVRERVAEIDELPPVDRAYRPATRLSSNLLVANPKFVVEFSYVSYHSQEYVEKSARAFLQRLERGQCFGQPGMGRRRYLADFRPVEPTDEPIKLNHPLGEFPWGMEYRQDGQVLHTRPMVIEDGVLNVPSWFEHAYQQGYWP